jgi:hypothetical protein
VKFLVDNQLPRELAQYLRDRGLDCQHVVEASLSQASDAQICRYANSEAASSLARMRISSTGHADPKPASRSSGFDWATAAPPALLAAFDALWTRIEERLNAGDAVIEVR